MLEEGSQITNLEHRVEDRDSEVDLASFARGHSADHVCAIVDGLLAMKRTLLSSETLANDPGGFGQF